MPGKPITKLLVANRGEIARRVFKTCRRLGIATVAVYSDTDAGALFVREADEALALGGATAAESYLRHELILAAAARASADAIHPGYGFLSENAQFAQMVLDAGLIWIGPAPEAIAAMGSKTQARDLMEAAGVPVLPGRRLSGSEANGDLEAAAAAVGFPLLVKAAAGGGGKGMRVVSDLSSLESSVQAARREASAAFGDDEVFLEAFAPRSRHVEIQILGDQHGRVISLGERDCSVQRRHQKVIEESPSPALDEELREAMSQAGVAAGTELGYVGAGTVEFLLVAERREFFFLEVNTRLQVEHPVTELVRGVDLVELQLRVAQGEALPVQAPAANGHAVEVRLYAEDPANGFLPVTGRLSRFEIGGAAVRVDTGVESGSEISPHFDPMLAKVIAHGATRGEAVRKLADALRRAELHGMTTNRDFLVNVLEHPEFAAGDADTSFLERADLGLLAAPLDGADAGARAAAAAAAAVALQRERRASARVLGSLPSGWRNVRAQPQSVALAVASGASGEPLTVSYEFDRAGELRSLAVDGEPLGATALHGCSGEEVDLELDGLRRRFTVRRYGDDVYVNTARAQSAFTIVPRHPSAVADSLPIGSLTAPMPGAVLRLMTTVGARVEQGQPLLVLEAMKMEHEIVAPVAGRVTELPVEQGEQVQAGAVLAIIDTGEDNE
ncbi:MAG: acetyl/propionyl/methylcrotonyl-CoA carboxylase subunit alpha [Solirubrobacteraceae bacterium]